MYYLRCVSITLSGKAWRESQLQIANARKCYRDSNFDTVLSYPAKFTETVERYPVRFSKAGIDDAMLGNRETVVLDELKSNLKDLQRHRQIFLKLPTTVASERKCRQLSPAIIIKRKEPITLCIL